MSECEYLSLLYFLVKCFLQLNKLKIFNDNEARSSLAQQEVSMMTNAVHYLPLTLIASADEDEGFEQERA